MFYSWISIENQNSQRQSVLFKGRQLVFKLLISSLNSSICGFSQMDIMEERSSLWESQQIDGSWACNIWKAPEFKIRLEKIYKSWDCLVGDYIKKTRAIIWQYSSMTTKILIEIISLISLSSSQIYYFSRETSFLAHKLVPRLHLIHLVESGMGISFTVQLMSNFHSLSRQFMTKSL